jgi:hypothetical protein
MIMPNECRRKVDISQPTVTYSAGAPAFAFPGFLS